MSDELIAAIGPLPRTHGLLGAMLEADRAATAPTTSTRDPRFRGWWPARTRTCARSSACRSSRAASVIGALLPHRQGGRRAFADDDQELIELLAAHAAIAIENARLYERSRELSIVEERNRLALELHDAVSQKLFGLVLTAEAAATLLDRDPDAAREQLDAAAARSRARRSTSCAR